MTAAMSWLAATAKADSGRSRRKLQHERRPALRHHRHRRGGHARHRVRLAVRAIMKPREAGQVVMTWIDYAPGWVRVLLFLLLMLAAFALVGLGAAWFDLNVG
jgi:hypothetical protein